MAGRRRWEFVSGEVMTEDGVEYPQSQVPSYHWMQCNLISVTLDVINSALLSTFHPPVLVLNPIFWMLSKYLT